MSWLAPALLPVLGTMGAGQLLLVFLSPRRLWDANTRLLAALATALGAVLLLSLTMHWASFRLFGLLLPRERTGLYVAPLSVLILGASAAVVARSRAESFWRFGLIVMLFATGTYFLLCLRLTYFKEWRFDADVKRVYAVLSYYNRTYGLKEVAASWQYVAPLNFYRIMSLEESIAPFVAPDTYPEDKQVYVLDYGLDHAFIAEQGLRIVYKGNSTDVVIAVRPEVATWTRPQY